MVNGELESVYELPQGMGEPEEMPDLTRALEMH